MWGSCETWARLECAIRRFSHNPISKGPVQPTGRFLLTNFTYVTESFLSCFIKASKDGQLAIIIAS